MRKVLLNRNNDFKKLGAVNLSLEGGEGGGDDFSLVLTLFCITFRILGLWCQGSFFDTINFETPMLCKSCRL